MHHFILLNKSCWTEIFEILYAVQIAKFCRLFESRHVVNCQPILHKRCIFNKQMSQYFALIPQYLSNATTDYITLHKNVLLQHICRKGKCLPRIVILWWRLPFILGITVLDHKFYRNLDRPIIDIDLYTESHTLHGVRL